MVLGGFIRFINLVYKAFVKLINSELKMVGPAFRMTDPGLFHTFYEQPIIKYLSAGGFSNKPSYITPRNFSKALVDSILANYSSKGIINHLQSEMEVLAKTMENSDEGSIIKKEFDARENKGENFKEWFNRLDDSKKIRFGESLLPEGHAFKVQLKAMLTSFDPDLEIMDKNLITSLTDTSILEKIKAGIAVLPVGSDTKKHLESLLADAQEDLQKFLLYLEEWFDDSMEQATGWFKRRIQYILFFIGFFLAVSFNADTFQMIKKLSNDPKARAHIVDLAIEYSEGLRSQENTLRNLNEEDSSVQPTTETPDVAEENERIKRANDSLLQVAKALQSDIMEAQNTIASNWKIPDSVAINNDSVLLEGFYRHSYPLAIWDSSYIDKKWVRKIDSVTVSSMLDKSIDKAIFNKVIPPTSRAAYEKGKIDVRQNAYKWRYVLNLDHILGYILTALAISMGSPFWFDLLNRLIQLRNSVRPDKD